MRRGASHFLQLIFFIASQTKSFECQNPREKHIFKPQNCLWSHKTHSSNEAQSKFLGRFYGQPKRRMAITGKSIFFAWIRRQLDFPSRMSQQKRKKRQEKEISWLWNVCDIRWMRLTGKSHQSHVRRTSCPSLPSSIQSDRILGLQKILFSLSSCFSKWIKWWFDFNVCRFASIDGHSSSFVIHASHERNCRLS